jgi:hypothetical protein
VSLDVLRIDGQHREKADRHADRGGEAHVSGCDLSSRIGVVAERADVRIVLAAETAGQKGEQD